MKQKLVAEQTVIHEDGQELLENSRVIDASSRQVKRPICFAFGRLYRNESRER